LPAPGLLALCSIDYNTANRSRNAAPAELSVADTRRHMRIRQFGLARKLLNPMLRADKLTPVSRRPERHRISSEDRL